MSPNTHTRITGLIVRDIIHIRTYNAQNAIRTSVLRTSRMYLVQTIIRARPLCDEYKKYTLIEWERCVFAKCRAPLKNATQCLSPRLSPVEKNSGGEEGYDNFGATTKQPRSRATHLLTTLRRLRILHARLVSNSNGIWLKRIMVIASTQARSSART